MGPLEIVKSEDMTPAIITPMTLLQSAQSQGSSIEQMQQLLELQIRWESNEARKAYNAAIAAFKAENISIVKDKQVAFSSTKYNHATLGNVVEQITVPMSRHNLSHSWDVNQDGGGIEVTCKISHRDGHFETVKMKASADKSGQKNEIQQIGSTVTYLQRYTLLSALGLATHDDDGKGATEKEIDLISEKQVMDILSLIKTVKADEKALCTYFKVADVASIPTAKYSQVVAMLEAKRGK